MSALVFLCVTGSLQGQENLHEAIEALEHDYAAFVLPGETYWDSIYISEKAGYGLNIGAGYNGNPMLDIGIGYGHTQTIRTKQIYSTLYLGSEFLFQEEETIIGPKFSLWSISFLGIISSGYNLIYYTDFKEGSFQFRPEIGLGYKGVKLSYGYNIPISNKHFGGISRNSISIALFLRLITKHADAYTYREIFNGEIELMKGSY